MKWLRSAAQFSALMLAVLVPALKDLGYRPLDAELLLFALGAMGVGMLLALAAPRVPFLDRLLFVLLAVLILDIYFLSSSWQVWLAALALGALVFTRFGSEARNVGATFAAAFVLLAAFSPARPLLEPALPATSNQRVTPEGETRPLVLHIVLDEQTSPLNASAETRERGVPERLVDGYVQRGFHVLTSVRATSGATHRSLSRVFGAGAPAERRQKPSARYDDFERHVQGNQLLQDLLKRQYAVSVIQSTFLELCVNSTARCHTYPRVNYGHAMRRFDSALATRLQLAGALLHVELLDTQGVRGVPLYRALTEFATDQGLLSARTKRQYWTRPASVLEILDTLEGHSVNMQPGEAWIVHLLLPHFPYVLDSRCGLRPYEGWSVPPWTSDRAMPAVPAARLESDYWQQMECVHTRVLALIDRLDDERGAANVRVLIHGDHGARLKEKQTSPDANTLHAAEPNGSLDTLVLVRAPGLAPGVDDTRMPLPEAVRLGYAAMELPSMPIAAPAQ